jgi:hypothetical protein
MKYAVAKPLFKKGDRSSISNYRPISILSSFSKVIEKIVYSQLQEHLNKYSILAEEQFGFRGNSSTSKAIYKPINESLQALNKKSLVGGIFFDLEKAFDCLNHDILISKLQFYGVNGKAKQWFQSYPNNRYQRSRVLAPLLSLIYITDFTEVVSDKTIPILFAKDTDILLRSSKTKNFHNMIDAFTFVYNWFRINLLSLYRNKTHCIQFKTKNKSKTDINTVCNNRPVTTTSNVKVPWCTYKSLRQPELSF